MLEFQAGSAAKLQSKKTFQGTVQAKDIHVDHLVNGFDFDKEVVTLDGGGAIYGVPHLKKLVVDGDIDRVGLTNDIDLSNMAAGALYLDGTINSKGNWKINTADVKGDNFLQSLSGNLNGLSIQQLVAAGNSNSSTINQSKVRLV